MAFAVIRGNLGKDPELRTSEKGTQYTRFSVAWSERYRTPQGEWVEGPTVWVSVTAYGKQAEGIAATLHKGTRVVVSGTLQPEMWNSSHGEETVFTMNAQEVGVDVMFQDVQVSKRSSGYGGGNTPGRSGGQGGNPWGGSPQGGFGETEEEPPF